MRSLLYIVTALAVIGLAFWAYRENYQTQAEIARTDLVTHIAKILGEAAP